MSNTIEKPSLESEVLTVLRLAGEAGLTDEQIGLAIRERGRPCRESSPRARRVALVEAGLVANSGRTRRTSCDVLAKVWIASKPHAAEQLVFEGFDG